MSKRLYQVGLTGSIGAGKSLAAEHFIAQSIPVFNLDEIGRELMQQDASLVQQVHQICGIEDQTFRPDLVKERIFANFQLRHSIESLLHPAIFAVYEAKAKAANQLVICEAALLYESGYYKNLDEVVLIVAPFQKRKERVMKRSGMTETLFDKIDHSQWSDDKRTLLATTVIHNDQSFDALKDQLDRLIEDWKERDLL